MGSQRDTMQDEIDEYNTTIHNCNMAGQAAIDVLLLASNNARSTHISCRHTELDLNEAYFADCAAVNALVQGWHTSGAGPHAQSYCNKPAYSSDAGAATAWDTWYESGTNFF